MEIRNRDREAPPFRTKDGSAIREYLHTDRQSLAEASLEPGQRTQRHYHRRSEEIYLLVEGAGRIRVGEEERTVVSGDVVLIPPGAWHDIIGGDPGVRFLCLCAPPYSDDDTYFE